ncbi:MAG: MFS transporter [Clostridia bacterium]|nr:MFS transporter [Clostridia bacterium]
MNRSQFNYRWVCLITAVIAMLFAGILYAWSILKIPFLTEFGWQDSALAFNFTLTMCTFCLGAFAGSHLTKKAGTAPVLILAGLLAGSGFLLTGFLTGSSIALLYLTYGILAGSGIGIAYNVLISSVSAWFPDKKGLCSGCLMMGFGASTLLLGSLISALYEPDSLGWRKTLMLLGLVLAAVLIVSALIVSRPGETVRLPAPKKNRGSLSEDFEGKDMTPSQMIRRFTFWRAFILLVCLTAVGNSVISFARDLVLSVGASAAMATTMVGVLSVCNGLGRVLTGALFDAAGRRITMTAANLLTITAAAVTLIAVLTSSVPLCIVGLCLTGLSYGSCPTLCSAFVSSFYGQKHFATNFSIVNFNLIFASFIATASAGLYTGTGSYTAPFLLLLALAVGALALNFSIRKP